MEDVEEVGRREGGEMLLIHKKNKKNLKREGREKQWTILQTCQFSCISKNSMEMVCAPSELFLTGLVLSMSIILCRCQLHILYIHC